MGPNLVGCLFFRRHIERSSEILDEADENSCGDHLGSIGSNLGLFGFDNNLLIATPSATSRKASAGTQQGGAGLAAVGGQA